MKSNRIGILTCMVTGVLISWWNPVLAVGQGEFSPATEVDHDAFVRETLKRPISLELRDATVLEALFSVRDASGLNLIVGDEITGTVNAAFTETAVHKVLDSLLLPRGYGYRIISGSVAIVSLESIGDQLPLFETVVVRLHASSPADLLPTIESLLSPEGRVHSVPSSNSIVIMDYRDRLESARKQIEALESAAVEHRHSTQSNATLQIRSNSTGFPAPDAVVPTIVQVFRPQYVPATILADAIQPLLSLSGRTSPLQNEDKLVVIDTPEAMERIAIAIRELDLPRSQVRIWALIYDCGLEDVKRIGVNWRSGVNGASVGATGTPNQSIGLDALTSTVATGSPNGALTINSLNRYVNITSVIQCLNSADDSRLLADPNVVVMNHEAANIAIVTEVPYQQLTQGIQGGAIGTTEFREAGVSLNVTPHIAQDNTISMIINPRFSLLTGFTETTDAPIIDRRETTTTVRVENGQTLVLGGLRQRNRMTERSAVPGLSKVPYLGHLFRFKRNATRESELIVFITPEIISPDYVGTAREVCISETQKLEIEQTPTDPIPYGMQAIEAEDRARDREIDRIRKSANCNGQNCSTPCEDGLIE